MQEIGTNVYIETDYAGVTLGLIKSGNGMILIDAPFLPEDIRSWRAAVAALNGWGTDRFLVHMDANVDRIVGARAMDSIVVGHEALAQIFQTRPFPYRSQSMTTGAEWEAFDNLGAFRWAPPELTFCNEMSLYSEDMRVVLQECGGAEPAALWVKIPCQHILFVGDQVIREQPPFFANANIPLWIETLHCLQNPKYDDYTLVGGRDGIIRQEDIRWMLQYLEKVQAALDELKICSAPESEVEGLVPGLLEPYDSTPAQKALYQKRLTWGLTTYYVKNFFPERIKEVEV